MKFKRLIHKLHLWLGIISGAIVFVVCITGAIWALKINGWVGEDSSKTFIEANGRTLLPPSTVIELSKQPLGNRVPNFITYNKNSVVTVSAWGKGYDCSLEMDPYTGKILKTEGVQGTGQKGRFDLWDFVRHGHRALWLPWNIGSPIVNYATLTFMIVLLSGLILWIPKTKKAAANRLSFRWKKQTKMSRKMYDLHVVLGFYTCFILLAVGFTGMVWGLEWWSKGTYKLTTGGDDLPAWKALSSDSTQTSMRSGLSRNLDIAFEKVASAHHHYEAVEISVPDSADAAAAISVTGYPDHRLYYNVDRFSFDRYTLKELKSDNPYQGKYVDKKPGEKLRRMNYDIHVGAIAGTPGRVLVFLAALFGASLPLTGAYLYLKPLLRRKAPRKRSEEC